MVFKKGVEPGEKDVLCQLAKRRKKTGASINLCLRGVGIFARFMNWNDSSRRPKLGKIQKFKDFQLL